MKTRYFWLPFICGFLLAAISSYVVVKPFLNPETNLDVFKSEYRNLSGQPFVLTKNSDKIRLISYWATWCKPCVAEFKDFKELKEKYGNQLEIIANSDEPAAKIERFKARHQYDFKFVRSDKAFPDLGINAIPVNVVLDKNGNTLLSEVGQLSTRKMEVLLEK